MYLPNTLKHTQLLSSLMLIDISILPRPYPVELFPYTEADRSYIMACLIINKYDRVYVFIPIDQLAEAIFPTKATSHA